MNAAIVTTTFLAIIYSLPFYSNNFLGNKNSIYSYWIVISLYQIVAFTNAFLFRTLGADMDANSFHVIGVEISKSGVFEFHSDVGLYKNILGFLYWLTDDAIIIGEQLSILLIGFSIVFLVKIIDKLKLNEYQTPLILLYAGLPTMFMLGAITLREPIQVSLLIISFYFGLKMKLDSKYKILNFCLLALFAFLAGIFHRGVLVFALFLIFVFLISDIGNNNKKLMISTNRLITLLVTPFLLYIFFYALSNSDITGSEILRKFLSLEILEAMRLHRTYTPIGRASYEAPFDYSSILMTILSSCKIYFHYLFEPFVWKISSLPDIYAASEAMLHLILIYYSIKTWILEQGERKKILGLMIILFFVLTLIFAIGTTNYGTGMRHKMLSWWLIVLMGGPALFERIKQLTLKKISNV